MVTATVFFLLAAIVGNDGYHSSNVTSGAFVLTLIGYGLLALGGWLGGAIVFVHGMRVLSLVKEPTERAISPVPHAEKEEAEGG
jgi:Na+/H+-dicarboxylate symporter